MFGARRLRLRRAAEAHPEQNDTPAVARAVDVIEQIKDLDELRGQGILTDEEFTAEKKKLLG
jgi:Short C-terminal domain